MKSSWPCSDLERDCRSICADPKVRQALASYLQGNPVIQESVATLLASFPITANARSEEVPAIQRPLARVGSRLARWLPTFLIIDGPLGRVLRDADSPLKAALEVDRDRIQPSLTLAIYSTMTSSGASVTASATGHSYGATPATGR